MRLIDADELKKCAIPCEIHNGTLTDLCIPLYQIDNAPTVTKIDTDDIEYKAYCKGLEDGKKIARPQVEWKVNNYGEHICPICGNYALYDESQDNDYYEAQSNFCPECGADMRGSKNE